MNTYHTTYDDVFRTLIVYCKSLLIPLVNEIFHEYYNTLWKVVLHHNEIFLRQQDGEEEKRITDSSFSLVSTNGTTKRYHLECQSNTDNSMLIRMYEYDSQIALQDGEIKTDTLTVKFPVSGILYLRHTKNTPDYFKVHISTPGGDILYHIPTLKVKQYSIDEIFDKNLFFLIPFYIFSFEVKLEEINNDENKLKLLQQEYIHIVQRLNTVTENGTIDEYTRTLLCELTAKVIQRLAAKHEHIVKEVTDIMYGKVLDLETVRIFKNGAFEALSSLVKKGLLAIEDAAREMDMSVEEFQKKMNM